jgi:hypothetical protein
VIAVMANYVPTIGAKSKLTDVNFWVITRPSGGFPYDYCILQRDATMAAINKVLTSGVEEYHVGSRGLKRLSLKDLMDYLQFWINAANDAALGYSSAIQTRRGVPCDA